MAISITFKSPYGSNPRGHMIFSRNEREIFTVNQDNKGDKYIVKNLTNEKVSHVFGLMSTNNLFAGVVCGHIRASNIGVGKFEITKFDITTAITDKINEELSIINSDIKFIENMDTISSDLKVRGIAALQTLCILKKNYLQYLHL